MIGREGHLRVIRFKNYVNDSYMNSYNADGIIISTPTGSTRLQPVGRRTCGFPECQYDDHDTYCASYYEYPKYHSFRGKRQLLWRSAREDIIPLRKRWHLLTGDTQISMVTGDRIVIRKATVRTKILKLNHLSFVEVLETENEQQLMQEVQFLKVARHEKLSN